MSQENDIEHSMSANDVSGVLADQSEVLLDTNGENHFNESHDEQWQERESRNALKHVSGLGEMQDVTEVEYRKVRLERVVLVGVWSSRETTQAQAEESLRELAALAETAGAVVCDGLLQHRIKPDAATYVGSVKPANSPESWRKRSRHHRCGRRPAASQRRALGRRHQSEGRGSHCRDPRHFRPTMRPHRRAKAKWNCTTPLPAATTASWADHCRDRTGGRAAGDAGLGSRGTWRKQNRKWTPVGIPKPQSPTPQTDRTDVSRA